MIKILTKLVGLFAAIGFVLSTTEIVIESSSEIRSYKIHEGDNLLVICNATNSSDLEIYWSKNDTSSTFFQPGERLEIEDIKRFDSGYYICHALNTSYPVPEFNETDANRTVVVVNVDVQYPAEIPYFDIEPSDLHVMENGTFNISCYMLGNPGPTWSIRNNDTGNAITSATGHANVTLGPITATCDDLGYWECTGSNSLNNGVNVTKGHNLTVYCAPRPRRDGNQFVYQARVGQYTILYMYLHAYPRANYTWTKDDDTDISGVAKQDDFDKETLLTFPGITVPYFGNYTLTMQNEYGSYEAHYQIVAYGPPETPTNLQFSDVTYDSVKLRWTSGFDMGSKQHFIVIKLLGNSYSQLSVWIFDNSTNHGINQNWTYTVKGLVSDTDYNLTVLAENERGFTSPFAKPHISFRTSVYPEPKRPEEKQLIIGLTLGTIATVLMLLFMVYVIRTRKLRSTYDVMKE